MILGGVMVTITCRHCDSSNIIRNGRTKSGQQKYYCKACSFCGTLDTKDEERIEKKQLVEKLHREQVSQRGIARITGLSRNTIAKILKQSHSVLRK
jgi:transposase-like protein